MQTKHSIKSGTIEELNVLAQRLVNASTQAEADNLKQQYLAGFYGISVQTENPTGKDPRSCAVPLG